VAKSVACAPNQLLRTYRLVPGSTPLEADNIPWIQLRGWSSCKLPSGIYSGVSHQAKCCWGMCLSAEVFNLFYTVDPTDIPSSGGGPP